MLTLRLVRQFCLLSSSWTQQCLSWVLTFQALRRTRRLVARAKALRGRSYIYVVSSACWRGPASLSVNNHHLTIRTLSKTLTSSPAASHHTINHVYSILVGAAMADNPRLTPGYPNRTEVIEYVHQAFAEANQTCTAPWFWVSIFSLVRISEFADNCYRFCEHCIAESFSHVLKYHSHHLWRLLRRHLAHRSLSPGWPLPSLGCSLEQKQYARIILLLQAFSVCAVLSIAFYQADGYTAHWGVWYEGFAICALFLLYGEVAETSGKTGIEITPNTHGLSSGSEDNSNSRPLRAWNEVGISCLWWSSGLVPNANSVAAPRHSGPPDHGHSSVYSRCHWGHLRHHRPALPAARKGGRNHHFHSASQHHRRLSGLLLHWTSLQGEHWHESAESLCQACCLQDYCDSGGGARNRLQLLGRERHIPSLPATLHQLEWFCQRTAVPVELVLCATGFIWVYGIEQYRAPGPFKTSIWTAVLQTLPIDIVKATLAAFRNRKSYTNLDMMDWLINLCAAVLSCTAMSAYKTMNLP